MSLVAAYGLLAWALVCGSVACLFPAGEFRQRAALTATAISMIGIAPGLYGAFAAPSFTLLQLALLRQFSAYPWPLGLRPSLFLLAGAAVFYPLALGLGSFEVFALGYTPQLLMPLVLGFGAWLAWRRQTLWLMVLALDLMAYAAGFFQNLWSALFDPLLVLLAFYQLVRALLLRRVSKKAGA